MLQDPDKLLLLRLQACKRQGDADLEQGNLRDAINAYTEALNLLAPPASPSTNSCTTDSAARTSTRIGGVFSASSRQIQQEVLPALLGNRSRARCEAGRHEEALEDALRVLQLNQAQASAATEGGHLHSQSKLKGAPVAMPGASSRAHYRAGRALDGLKQWVPRVGAGCSDCCIRCRAQCRPVGALDGLLLWV